jgi:hypothetical protein
MLPLVWPQVGRVAERRWPAILLAVIRLAVVRGGPAPSHSRRSSMSAAYDEARAVVLNGPGRRKMANCHWRRAHKRKPRWRRRGLDGDCRGGMEGDPRLAQLIPLRSRRYRNKIRTQPLRHPGRTMPLWPPLVSLGFRDGPSSGAPLEGIANGKAAGVYKGQPPSIDVKKFVS